MDQIVKSAKVGSVQGDKDRNLAYSSDEWKNPIFLVQCKPILL